METKVPQMAEPSSVDRDGGADTAPVLEVFASLQGEGLYAGQPQVFLRLSGCPLRCRYCDTPHSWLVRPRHRPELALRRALDPVDHGRLVGSSRWSAEDAALAIGAAEWGGPRTVSATGGEPLLWPGFLRRLAEAIHPRPLHLETAGAHPEALEALLPFLHHVSMDLKLASDMGAPVPVAAADPFGIGPSDMPRDRGEWRAVRHHTLPLLVGRDACAKLVVTGETDLDEAREALLDVARLAPRLVVFLQPATAIGRASAPDRARVEELVEYALGLGLLVRSLPQIHRLLGLP